MRSKSLERRTCIAVARFMCCERSVWQDTIIPVGMCVMRTAESVMLTYWPPAPLERKVSILRSSGRISICTLSGSTGTTSTEAKLVWRRFAESKGDMRTRR